MRIEIHKLIKAFTLLILSLSSLQASATSCYNLLNSPLVFPPYEGRRAQLPSELVGAADVFFLGAGAFGRVYRVHSSVDSTSFVLKHYNDHLQYMNDLGSLNYLRTLNPEVNNIRIIKVDKRSKFPNLMLEDVKGRTLYDVVAEQLLPSHQIDYLLTDLLNFQERALKRIETESRGIRGMIFYSGPPTSKFRLGIPNLKAEFGFPWKKRFFLKPDNILVDVHKLQLVISDPY